MRVRQCASMALSLALFSKDLSATRFDEREVAFFADRTIFRLVGYDVHADEVDELDPEVYLAVASVDD